MRAQQQGSTLIEALVALAVFGIGILGVVASSTHHARAGLDARYRTEAAAAADELVGLIQTAAPATRVVRYSTGGDGYNDWLVNRLQRAATGLPGAQATVDFSVVGADDRTVRIEVRWTAPRDTVQDAAGAKTAQATTHRYRTVSALVR